MDNKSLGAFLELVVGCHKIANNLEQQEKNLDEQNR
jgi:hypothetical protein